jgi:hypothetical protein
MERKKELAQMFKAICLAIASASLAACQGSTGSQPTGTQGSGDPFANGGGPAPQTVEISAEDGTKYTGQATIGAFQTQNKAFLTILASDASGVHNWAAQLTLAAADFAKGDVTLTLRPGPQTPNTGFIDDQGSPQTFSDSGTMHIIFAPGRQFTATLNTDKAQFSGSLGGTYSFNCSIPAAGNPNGYSSSGGTLVQLDTSLSSTFCQQFKWLQ